MTKPVAPGAPTTDQIISIALVDLRPHPANRKHFDKQKFQDLVANIAKIGVLTPILVRPLVDLPPNTYQIIAGERRWKAAQKAGLEDIRAVVREMTDDEALEILITENLQREDPHPLEEADTFQAWLDRPGHDVVGLAAKIGKSVGYIYQRLQLRKLVEPAKKMFWDDKLPLTLALLLSREPEATQKDHLGRIQREANWRGLPTTAELTRELQRGHKDLAKAPFATDSSDLVKEAGSCLACPKRTGFTPELFPEISGKKADHCTDGGCFTKKLQAHLKLEEARLRKEHPDLVLASTAWGHAPPKEGHPITQPQWKAAKKTEKGAKLALFVDGDDLGTTGWVTVGKQKKASSPARKPSHSSGSSKPADNGKAELKRRIEIGRRQAVAKEVLVGVSRGLDRRVLLIFLANELGFLDYNLELFVKITGIKTKGPMRPHVTAKDLQKLSDQQLNQLTALLAMGEDIEYAGGTPEHLIALAEALKLKPKAIGDRFEAAVKKGQKGQCSKCFCTETDACSKGGKKCSWANAEQTLCTACKPAEKKPAKKGAKK